MMSNIKTIKVIKETMGLLPGTTLSRMDNTKDFFNIEDCVGEGYLISTSMVVSPNSVTDEFFEVTEWFDPIKDPKSKQEPKLTYKQLANELKMYIDLHDLQLETISELSNTINDLNSKAQSQHDDIYSLIKEVTKSRNIINKRDNRIDSKLIEFKIELDNISKQLELNKIDGRDISGERLEMLSESYIVHYNMIDLLEKIKA